MFQTGWIFSVERRRNLLKKDLRRNLFYLFAGWSGRFGQPFSHSRSSTLDRSTPSEFEFSALQVSESAHFLHVIVATDDLWHAFSDPNGRMLKQPPLNLWHASLGKKECNPRDYIKTLNATFPIVNFSVFVRLLTIIFPSNLEVYSSSAPSWLAHNMSTDIYIGWSCNNPKAAETTVASILSGRRFYTCFQKLFHDLIYLAIKS